MAATVAAIALALVVTLSLLAGWLVQFIPFSAEQRIAHAVLEQLPAASQGERHRQIEEYLQGLADRLVASAPLPAGMSIEVHYVDDDTVNAAATIGGHVLLFRGLLEKLPSENALAMVMAHEIAHVRHRDPIMSLGRGVVATTALAALTGFSDSAISGWVLNFSGDLTLLKFSRDQERAADRDGLRALYHTYGHTAGSDQLFYVLGRAGEESQQWAGFLSTHPLSERRIAGMVELAKQHGWAQNGPLTELPPFVSTEQ